MPSLREPAPVRVYGVVIGHLHRDAHGAIRFIPDGDWLAGQQHPPLGLAMLRSPGIRLASTGLPIWFENLLPEVDGALRKLVCKRLKIRLTDSAALLEALGGDLPGAVEVGGGESPDQPSEEIEEDIGEGAMPSGLRISLAGLQLKLSMLLVGERLILPLKGSIGKWIVKVPSSNLQELPQVEAATMSWARTVGLFVPDFRVVESSNIDGIDSKLIESVPFVFAIQRFDRTTDGRIHQEDFAQVYEIAPGLKYGKDAQKYKPGGTIRYSGMARQIEDVCGRQERDRFLERVAFVIGSGNDDAHLKNWSLQWGHEHRPWLSPCYDMVATVSWPDASTDELALELARGIGRFALLDRHAIRRFLEASGATDAEEKFFDVLQRMRARWLDLEGVPDRMRSALVAHWQRVPILRDMGGLPTS